MIRPKLLRTAARSSSNPRGEPADTGTYTACFGLGELGLTNRLVAVKNCLAIGKRDLPFNDTLPEITVDSDTYTGTADGEELRCEPLSTLPMVQRYFLL
jgi:urease alpha subunit